MSANFSVLTSVYYKEHPEYLRQSLESLFSQTVIPTEIIIVKDGPLTLELDSVIAEFINKYSIIKVVTLQENLGLGFALNEGLKYCSYDLVARMDTDDIAKENRFERQLSVFEMFPQVEVVSSWIDEFIENTRNVISVRTLPEYPYEIYKYGRKRCPINHPAVMFRKKTILFAGGYEPFPLFEDYYLWVRLLLNGAKFYNIQESLLYFRTSEDMYRRRGGLKHAINELKFQNLIRKMGYIDIPLFLFNITVRFITRLVPNSIRAHIYKRFLRK